MPPTWTERRRLELEVLAALAADGRFLSEVMAARFRAEPGLDPARRAEVARAVRAVIARRKLLDAALGEAAAAGPERRRERARLLALDVLEGRVEPAEASALVPGLPWGGVRGFVLALDAEPDPVRRLALRGSMPEWLAVRLVAAHGDEAGRLGEALLEEPPRTLRANLLKTDRAALAARLAGEGIATSEGRLASTALHAIGPGDLFRTVAFHEGLFEVQDEGSQLLAEVVAPPPGGFVLDTCAGSGGKALALAAALRGKGRILALDVAEAKVKDLRLRARRAGAGQVQALVTAEDAWSAEVAAFARKADRILVDAPCSGTGALRRNPMARWTLGEDDLPRLAALQHAIAARAAAHLRPGARLVYATCSLLEEENEAVVRRLLAEDSGLERVRLAEIWGRARAAPLSDPDGAALVLLPDRHGTDGFFAAVLRRRR